LLADEVQGNTNRRFRETGKTIAGDNDDINRSVASALGAREAKEDDDGMTKSILGIKDLQA
jgi:hypothetical protein